MPSMESDVLVIGGGATGAGVLFDLAQRGVRVVLVEQNDIATGTSGRYHGLLHSGGRYVVRDPESARECIEENTVLRKIAPHVIEDTGGVFLSTPGDDLSYIPRWLDGCAKAGIPVEQIPLRTLRKDYPALNPGAQDAYKVPDASCDSFDLIHSLVEGAAAFGGKTLVYHQMHSIDRENGRIVGATVENRHTGEVFRIHARVIVNATGPWAAEVGKLAGVTIPMTLSKGIMIAMNMRWVRQVINRLNKPGDGDILVPVGTVSVIGTTSVTVQHPDDTTITPAEVSLMLEEGERLVPGFRKARALRAWGGVRPLYSPPQKPVEHSGNQSNAEGDEGRWLSRTYTTLDHTDQAAAGMLSIVGGKLTTYRQMAEQISDRVCALLGVSAPCKTATTVLPIPSWSRAPRGKYRALTHRLNHLESAPEHNQLICECEIVTRPQLEEAIRAEGQAVSLDDLRRDLRLGMGPCQGGFCAYRATGILQETRALPAGEAVGAFEAFVEERFRGHRPLLWGHQLRQALLDEMIYRRCFGLQPESASHPVAMGENASV